MPVMCGPRGLKGTYSQLYHNNGDGTFTDVTEKIRRGQNLRLLLLYRADRRFR